MRCVERVSTGSFRHKKSQTQDLDCTIRCRFGVDTRNEVRKKEIWSKIPLTDKVKRQGAGDQTRTVKERGPGMEPPSDFFDPDIRDPGLPSGCSTGTGQEHDVSILPLHHATNTAHG